MSKTILITGSTDGIGLVTAKMLAGQGHKVLLHGRSRPKLDAALADVGAGSEGFLADLSSLAEVQTLAEAVTAKNNRVDVLINNAGILKSPSPMTPDGYDIRFVVNTFAPLVLTRRLLSILPTDGRVVNLSSAAQAPIDPAAMAGQVALDDMGAYAQSKLAITIWTQELAKELPNGPAVIAVNPGSLLASKMVKEGFGVAGSDLSIGAKVLCDAALGDSFAAASGAYFDNDAGRFAPPHPAAQNPDHVRSVMQGIETALAALGQTSH
ncbi:MAG: SDR family NAD(P)-dependent oxidoreductase [Pseudomonadota bacterium]